MEQHFKNKYVYIVIGLACILSCTSKKKQSRTISKDMLYGEWTLVSILTQQECHIQRQGEKGILASHIIIA